MRSATARSAVLAPPVSGYWPGAPLLVLAMFAVVAVRLQEFIPFVGVLRPVLLVSVLGTTYLFIRTSDRGRDSALQDPLTRLVIVYFLWVMVTIPFALWKGLAFSTWRGLLPSVLMFGAVLLCAPHRRNLDRLQIGLVALILLFAIYTQVFGRMASGRLRLIGGMYDSNDMASLMAIGLPLAVGILARGARGRAKLIGWLAVVALGLAAIATGSRGGILALLAGLVVLAFGYRGARGGVMILALAAGLAAGWFTAPADFRERMMTLTNLERDYNYTNQSGRKAVWARGRGYIMDSPVVGVGAGNFPIAEGPGLAELGLTGKWSAAHNAYIQAYAELGLFGGSIFVGLLLVAAHRARKMWRVRSRSRRPKATDRPELLASLAAFAAGGYFLSHAYFPPAFALLGLIALADRVRAGETAGTGIQGPLPTRRVSGQRGHLGPVGQRGGLVATGLAARRQMLALRGGLARRGIVS